MKVLLVNGSPHQNGCTYTALTKAAAVFEQQGIETEIFWIGNKPISGCIGCGACRKGLGKCCIQEDTVNRFVQLCDNADGFIFGSPVHYAAISGALSSFMDRAFYSGAEKLRQKPAAGIVSCRRGGASAAFDELNKYFTINNMPVISSHYWNQVHGNTPEEVLRDVEGIQTVENLALQMSWIMKCIEAGKQSGITPPPIVKPARTNFIR